MTLPSHSTLLPSTRLMVVGMLFIGFHIVYMIRSGISIAIIAMIKSTPNTTDNSLDESPVPTSVNKLGDTEGLDWSEREVAWVLGAFFWGYTVSQFLGGWLATKFGGKWVYGFGVLGSSCLTIMVPLAAKTHVICMIAVRIATGLVEGISVPAYAAICGKWMPKFERTICNAIVLTGEMSGVIAAQFTAGYLCNLEFMGGWPLVFYIPGTAGTLWFITFSFTVYSSPQEHPRISQEELCFIEETMPAFSKSVSIPWKSILTSKHTWGCVFGYCGYSWIFYGTMTCIPQYLSKVLKYEISVDGVLSSTPFFCCWLFMTCNAYFNDKMRERNLISTTAVRKINQSLATFIPGICALVVAYSGSNKFQSIVALNLLMAFCGLAYNGAVTNPFDFAPSFAGIIYAMANTLGSMTGFLAPMVMSWMVDANPHSPELWKHMFFVFASIYVFTGLVFVLFATGDLQPWADVSDGESGTSRFQCQEKMTFSQENIPIAYIGPLSKRL